MRLTPVGGIGNEQIHSGGLCLGGRCWEGCTEAVMELLAQNLVGPRVLGRLSALTRADSFGRVRGGRGGIDGPQAKVASLFEFD